MACRNRNSNIEILRIISMLFIVMGHFCDQGKIFDGASGLNLFFLYFFGFGARISVNIFLLISVYFLVDREFNSMRIIKVYIETFFYTACLTTFILLIGYEVGLLDIIKGFLPFCGRALWFISAYITLCFIAPFINKMLELDFNSLSLLVVVSFLAVCGVSTMPDMQDAYLCDSLWFVVVYLWMGYVKKYYLARIGKVKNYLCFIGIAIYLILISVRFCMPMINLESIRKALDFLSGQYLVDIKTLPNVLCAACIFFGILLKEQTNNKFINLISKSTLATYVVHQTPAFKNYLWYEIFNANKIASSGCSAMYVVLVALVIFSSVCIVDIFRQRWIEPIALTSKSIMKLSKRLNKLYRND
jgi:hypothetical protein